MGSAGVSSSDVGVGHSGVRPASKGGIFSPIIDRNRAGGNSSTPFTLIDEDCSPIAAHPFSEGVRSEVNFGPFQHPVLDSSISKDLGADALSFSGSINGWKRRARDYKSKGKANAMELGKHNKRKAIQGISDAISIDADNNTVIGGSVVV